MLSLIISIYKNTQALEKVMWSVFQQKLLPDEIIITEDAEFLENDRLVSNLKVFSPCPIIHLRQKDIGNRKPLALNRAIAQAHGDYLVFIDGDCVLDRNFIQAHKDFSNEKAFLTGRRVELSSKASEYLSSDKIKQGYLNSFPWALAWDSITGETRHLGRMLSTPKLLRPILKQDDVFDIRGCNFSVHKKHLVSINGFSNNFSGAYGEDSDVEYRLKYLGLQMKSVKGAAIQYHLWHKTQDKDQENARKLDELKKEKNHQTQDGLMQIDQHP